MNINDLFNLLATYWQAIVAVALLFYFLFRQWKKGEINTVIDAVISWLKDYAQGELQNVTEKEVYAAAAIFYARYIEGATVLVRFISLAAFQSAAWAALEKLRDAYITASFELS